MDSTQAAHINDKELMVDPFLVEALQNPRHRLTLLRMELDIQRFLQNPDQQQFEFQHFATSYLRLAAHRVAQHYGLLTTVQENSIDGTMNKILVKKTPETKYPTVCLSHIPAKQPESYKAEQVKIVIRSRPKLGCMDGSNEFGTKRNPVRSVEERKEEYDKARARIFSGPSSPSSEDSASRVSLERKSSSPSEDEFEGYRNLNPASEVDKNGLTSDIGSARVAIFRDREKDRTDPDYDRSYDRYIRTLPANQSFAMAPFSMQKVQLPFVQYDSSIPQCSHMPRTHTSIGYGPQAAPVLSPFSAAGSNQTSRDPAYVQWPSAAMMYTHSYHQFRHAVFQPQQPLSFDYSQNH